MKRASKKDELKALALAHNKRPDNAATTVNNKSVTRGWKPLDIVLPRGAPDVAGAVVAQPKQVAAVAASRPASAAAATAAAAGTAAPVSAWKGRNPLLGAAAAPAVPVSSAAAAAATVAVAAAVALAPAPVSAWKVGAASVPVPSLAKVMSEQAKCTGYSTSPGPFDLGGFLTLSTLAEPPPPQQQSEPSISAAIEHDDENKAGRETTKQDQATAASCLPEKSGTPVESKRSGTNGTATTGAAFVDAAAALDIVTESARPSMDQPAVSISPQDQAKALLEGRQEAFLNCAARSLDACLRAGGLVRFPASTRHLLYGRSRVRPSGESYVTKRIVTEREFVSRQLAVSTQALKCRGILRSRLLEAARAKLKHLEAQLDKLIGRTDMRMYALDNLLAHREFGLNDFCLDDQERPRATNINRQCLAATDEFSIDEVVQSLPSLHTPEIKRPASSTTTTTTVVFDCPPTSARDMSQSCVAPHQGEFKGRIRLSIVRAPRSVQDSPLTFTVSATDLGAPDSGLDLSNPLDVSLVAVLYRGAYKTASDRRRRWVAVAESKVALAEHTKDKSAWPDLVSVSWPLVFVTKHFDERQCDEQVDWEEQQQETTSRQNRFRVLVFAESEAARLQHERLVQDIEHVKVHVVEKLASDMVAYKERHRKAFASAAREASRVCCLGVKAIDTPEALIEIETTRHGVVDARFARLVFRHIESMVEWAEDEYGISNPWWSDEDDDVWSYQHLAWGNVFKATDVSRHHEYLFNIDEVDVANERIWRRYYCDRKTFCRPLSPEEAKAIDRMRSRQRHLIAANKAKMQALRPGTSDCVA